MKVHTKATQLQFLILQSKVKVKTKTLRQQKQQEIQPQQRLIKLLKQQRQQQQQQQHLLKETRNFVWTTAAEALDEQSQKQKQYQRINEGEHSLLDTKQISLQLQHSKLAYTALADSLLLLVLQLLESTWLVNNAVQENKSKLNSLRRRD